MEDQLKHLYENGAAAFSTPQRLLREARRQGLEVSLKQVQETMDGWRIATRFKKKYKKPARNTKVVVGGPNQLVQADLCFFSPFNKIVGCLVAIDCFSRKIFAKTFRTKRPVEIARCFEKIIGEMETPPRTINTDLGSEFIGREFQNMLRSHRIVHMFTTSHHKSE
jgi:transposase InsO family protein